MNRTSDSRQILSRQNGNKPNSLARDRRNMWECSYCANILAGRQEKCQTLPVRDVACAKDINFRLVLPALLCAVLSVLPGLAQQPTSEETRTAPVIVDGSTLFYVRGVSAYPAEQRAKEVADRIVQVAANREIAKDSLRLVDTSNGTRIVAGDQTIITVVDGDSRLEAVDRQVLAQIFQVRITEAIESFRREREPAFLMRQALYALAATGILALTLFAVRLLRRAFEAHYRDRIHGVSIQSFELIRAEQLWRTLRAVASLISLVIVLIAIYLFLHFVLYLFPYTRALANNLSLALVKPVQTMGWALLLTIPDLVFLAVLFVITRYLLMLVRLLFDAIENGTIKLRSFDPSWSSPTYRLVRVGIVILAVVVAYPYIPGSESEAFRGVSLFIGVLVSLGSTSLIGNIIAGYTLTYRRTFKPGDRVKIGEHVGYVEQSRLMATFLRTPKNELVVVPNSKIINDEVINYTALARQEGLILHTTVGIGYDVPWRQVEAMLLEAAARTPGLVRKQPFILQKELGTFAITYELNVYCDRPRFIGRLYSDLHRNILDVFNEYGVQIMTPAYEGDPDQAKVVEKAKWYAEPAGPQTRVVSDASDAPPTPRAS